MNNCFQYRYLHSIDNNKALAAFNWAQYDSQKNVRLEDKKIIYTYKDGKQLYEGGKYELMRKIFGEVQRAQGGGTRDEIRLIYNNTTTEQEEELYYAFRKLESMRTKISTKEYAERLIDLLEDHGHSTDLNDINIEHMAENLRTRFKSFIPRTGAADTVTTSMNAADILKADGGNYTLDTSYMPTTQTIYSNAIDYLETKIFNEDYNIDHEDSGSDYPIGKYVHAFLFQDKNHAKGKSWIFNQVESITKGLDPDIEPGEKVFKISNMVQDTEDPNKEMENPEVQTKMSEGRLDPIKLIEEMASYKEIFGVLAIANTCFKDELWQFICKKIKKDVTTKKGANFGSDVEIHDILKNLKEKEVLKDCPKSKQSSALLKTAQNSKSWVYRAIQDAIRWLSYDVIDIVPYLIEHHFLHRTDLIRQCSCVVEFGDLIGKWDPENNNDCIRFTREQIIAERLNLRDNKDYLRHSDIVKLANCTVSELEEVMEECTRKINESKLMERRHESELEMAELALSQLRDKYNGGVIDDNTIDLTKKVYQLGNLTEPRYRGMLKPTNRASTHTIHCYVHNTPQGLVVTDINNKRLPNFQGITLRALNNFATAKLMHINGAFSEEKKEEIQAEIVKTQELIKGLNREIASLSGKEFSHLTQGVIKPTATATVDSHILNSWVDKLGYQYSLWISRKSRDPKYRKRIENNLSINLAEIRRECNSTYNNELEELEGPEGACANWFLSNQAEKKQLEQISHLYELTARGGKTSSGEAPTYCYVNKKGYYVVVLPHLHAIIPAWYGTLTKVAQTSDRYDKNIKFFADNIVHVIIQLRAEIDKIRNMYGEDSFEYLEALDELQEETGIFVLTQELAYEVIEELGAGSPQRLVKPRERVGTRGRERSGYIKPEYAANYLKLAEIAGTNPTPLNELMMR